MIEVKVFLVRHGETLANQRRLVQGWTDTPLTPTGQQQAAQAAHRLAGRHIEALFASDLGRAMATAQPIAEQLALPIAAAWQLREQCFGQLEGRQITSVNWACLDTNPSWRAKLEVEELDSFRLRVSFFFASLAAYPRPLSTIAVVAHGGTINRLLEIVNPDHHYQDYSNGQIVELQLDLMCQFSQTELVQA